MKNIITKFLGFLFVLTIIIAGIPALEVQATVKPVISSSQVTIKNNACSIQKGQKVKMSAKSGKKNITKKGTWKSSKKTVATVNKSGLLSAKKIGTTYITVRYKGKMSKKLKVIVIKNNKDNEQASEPDTTPAHESTYGTYTITYNKNNKNKSVKLKGSTTQSVSGEILNFAAKVDVSGTDGEKFIGWYDAPTGGNRIYETYVPTSNITLYAHYTKQNTQTVTFSLACDYGNSYSFMGGNHDLHLLEYDWLNKQYARGPLTFDDNDNVKWEHKYEVDGKTSFVIDNLPVPSVPGYKFDGWYTTDQTYLSSVKKGVKVENGQAIDTSVTRLYARFTKKITISFDDFQGNKYDDIEIESYKSIKDCGQQLPKPNIPGATFVGWTMDQDNHEYNWSFPMITENTQFFNCIEWYGFLCSGCEAISKHRRGSFMYCTPGCDTGFGAVNDDIHVFEETDHFTLYPVYEYHTVKLSFDPKGGKFPYTASENAMLRFEEDEDRDGSYNHKTVGTLLGNYRGSWPYGDAVIPGHVDDGHGTWIYGHGETTMPKVLRDNYVFDKWVYKDDDGVEREFTYDTILTKSMTVYAKWNPGKCYVMFEPTDGTLTQAERDRVGLDGAWSYNVTTESTIKGSGKELPVPVSSEGRKFLGWFDKEGEPVTEDTQVLANMTVYAQWGVLPKDLPVTLKFNANGGTFKDKGEDGSEVSIKTKTITRGETFAQLPELENRPDYDFVGWYIVNPNATEPYGKDAFLDQATTTTKPKDNMINSLNEILIVAEWDKVEHVSDIYVTDMDWETIDRHNNHYTVEYNGKYNDTGLGFTAVLLPETVCHELKNVKWTSSDPNIIYISGADTVYNSTWFDTLKFGGNLGDVVLTATSEDNPDVNFDIYITVEEKSASN